MSKHRYLYDIIYSTLKQEILNDIYPTGTLLPSERCICERFGVERTTARKALDLLVGKGLVEKRPGVGSEVVYNRNKGMGGTGGERKIIGFVIDDEKNTKKITEPYYADLFYHLERECDTNDHQLIYISIHDVADLIEVTRKTSFCAIIFATKTKREIIEHAMSEKIPVVLINESYSGAVSIFCDHSQGAKLALDYLLEMGHRRIGFITGPDSYLSSDYKMMRCTKSIQDYGLAMYKEDIIAGQWTYQSGYDAAQKLICQRQPLDRPTAIFAFNDMMAIGAMRAMRKAGISVPRDVSVIGFDNMEHLKFSEPDLTTIDGNSAELARITVHNIVSTDLDVYSEGVKILVPVSLIKRKTVSKASVQLGSLMLS